MMFLRYSDMYIIYIYNIHIYNIHIRISQKHHFLHFERIHHKPKTYIINRLSQITRLIIYLSFVISRMKSIFE